MCVYKEIFEIIAKRQTGILGLKKTAEVFADVGLKLNSDGSFADSPATLKNLTLLSERLFERYGPVTIMGCKIAVLKKARKQNLRLPNILVQRQQSSVAA